MHDLNFYHSIEDQNRKDKNEGEGKAVIFTNRPVLQLDKKSGKILSRTNEFGPVYFGTSSINPRYTLCFSGPEVNMKYLANHYGYVIRIRQPDKLVYEIASYLKQYSNMPYTMWLECVQVKYDKGQQMSKLPPPASEERSKMSYGHKDPKFSNDCEYRLVLTLPLIKNSPKEINIELRKELEYAEMVHLQTNNQKA
ncbi:MAG: hypothetical protein V1767_09175 [Chloroflexota bacterium]